MRIKDLNLNHLFIFFISLIAYIMPSLPIGGIDLDGSQVTLWSFFFIYFFHTQYFQTTRKSFYILLCILFFFLFSLPFVNTGNVVNIAEHSIAPQWYDLYHSLVTRFYFDKSRGYFLLIHLIEYYLVFLVSYKIGSSKGDYNKIFIISFGALLIIQTLLCFGQKFFLGVDRAYGSAGNAQAIGCLCIPIFIFKLQSKWKYADFIFFIPLLVFSDTRSSLATFALIVLLNWFKYRTIFRATIAMVIVNFIFAVVLVANEQSKTFVLGIALAIFGNTSTLTIRYLLWESSFMEVMKVSPIFGTFGRIPLFADNIFWFFLVPWGFAGLLSYVAFFFSLARLNNKRVVLLIFAFFFQGFSYYGYMVPPVAYMWWGILGYLVGEEFKNRSECRYYLSEKNL